MVQGGQLQKLLSDPVRRKEWLIALQRNDLLSATGAKGYHRVSVISLMTGAADMSATTGCAAITSSLVSNTNCTPAINKVCDIVFSQYQINNVDGLHIKVVALFSFVIGLLDNSPRIIQVTVVTICHSVGNGPLSPGATIPGRLPSIQILVHPR